MSGRHSIKDYGVYEWSEKGIRRLSCEMSMMESDEGVVVVLPIPITFLTGIDLDIQYQDGVRCSDFVSGKYYH
jgi:hypothetical protein